MGWRSDFFLVNSKEKKVHLILSNILASIRSLVFVFFIKKYIFINLYLVLNLMEKGKNLANQYLVFDIKQQNNKKEKKIVFQKNKIKLNSRNRYTSK